MKKQKKKEMKEKARKELDDFYQHRVEQMERVRSQNRVNNRTLEDELFNHAGDSASTTNGKQTATGSDWDKITSLCEFNPKNIRSQKDLSRYRTILLQLKQQPNSK